jgi:hypothetical protein
MNLRDGLVGALARSAGGWASLSTALMVASVAVVYAATRIEIPPLGCAVPQPAAKQAAFDVAVADVGKVTSVANWLALMGIAALGLGIAVSRGRGRLLILALPFAVAAFFVYGYGNDLRLPAGWCTQ